MKYIVLLGDGMADYPVPALDGKTPLEMAHIPNFDWLAQHGEVGLVQTIPEGMPPGSDVANLSVLGYDPRQNYSGRSPLEAVSMGIPLNDGDVTYRCNLVTVTAEAELSEATLVDHSSGEITTEESHELVKALLEKLPLQGFELYPGVSYRHCLVMRNGETGAELTPPHDIAGQVIGDRLPKGNNGEALRGLMEASRAILDAHPVNEARRKAGKNPANCCWFWGEGTKPTLAPFAEIYGVQGGIISAVDLLKGIAICAGLKAPHVPGATGTLDTNYQGKLDAALSILEQDDFVYMHYEGPDECGHQGNAADKITAIERLDAQVLKPLMAELDARGEDYNILLMPDHATPIVIRTHSDDPIPYILYKKNQAVEHPATAYTEAEAKKTGVFVANGYELMAKLLNLA